MQRRIRVTDTKMFKSNTPWGPHRFLALDGALWVVGALAVVCLSLPPLRPGVLEFVVGTVLGLVSSPFVVWGYIEWIKGMAALGKHVPPRLRFCW